LDLDNDVIFNQFEDIEEKVEFLIELYKSLEVTNSELKENVKNLELELQGKIEAEADLTKHKTMIKAKVEGLLSKLNNFSEIS